jgi:hypothetical protein
MPQEIEIRPGIKVALRVWWSIAWRAAVIGTVAGAAMKLAMRYIGHDNEDIVLAIMLVSVVLSVALEVWLIWHALSHHYGSFRIAVLHKEPGEKPLK